MRITWLLPKYPKPRLSQPNSTRSTTLNQPIQQKKYSKQELILPNRLAVLPTILSTRRTKQFTPRIQLLSNTNNSRTSRSISKGTWAECNRTRSSTTTRTSRCDPFQTPSITQSPQTTTTFTTSLPLPSFKTDTWTKVRTSFNNSSGLEPGSNHSCLTSPPPSTPARKVSNSTPTRRGLLLAPLGNPGGLDLLAESWKLVLPQVRPRHFWPRLSNSNANQCIAPDRN
jgi:hypothetical protein